MQVIAETEFEFTEVQKIKYFFQQLLFIVWLTISFVFNIDLSPGLE